jgi:hypothetical protein
MSQPLKSLAIKSLPLKSITLLSSLLALACSIAQAEDAAKPKTNQCTITLSMVKLCLAGVCN